MKKMYKINEIFRSVQTEGINTGRDTVFVRFSGCNLSCQFCDTNHSSFTKMSKYDIEKEVKALDKDGTALVVLTGGEPTVQITDDEPLFINRKNVAIETNGIGNVPWWCTHITVSPKTKLSESQYKKADEIKVVYDTISSSEIRKIESISRKFGTPLYIQPKADKHDKFDIEPVIKFVQSHPLWKISVQWHKLTGIR